MEMSIQGNGNKRTTVLTCPPPPGGSAVQNQRPLGGRVVLGGVDRNRDGTRSVDFITLTSFEVMLCGHALRSRVVFKAKLKS